MSSKKKTDKSKVKAETGKRALPSRNVQSAAKDASPSNLHSWINKIKLIWKRRPVLLAASIFIIVALIVGGVFAFQNTPEDKPPADTTNTAVPPPVTEKIEIQDVVVTDITDKSATVKWKTSVPATSEVSAIEQKGTNSVGGWPDSRLVREHAVVLDKLEPATGYTLKIQSKDAAGNAAIFESTNPFQTSPLRITTGIAIGQAVPNFSLNTITGENVSLSSYGDKRIMLVFWMMSCSSCREEMPHLRDFWESSKHDDLVLLAVNVGENETLIKNYVISQNLTFPILLDGDSTVSKKYTIVRYPTIFLLSPDKTVLKIREDPFKNAAEIEDFVRPPAQPK